VEGVVSYGAYVPRHRLERAAVRAALGQGGGRGSRSVAGYDEDSTSMGVEAARAARWNGARPSGLHFATTAPAYADKTNATTLHAALGLPREVFATDHGASVRCAVGALRAAAAEDGLAVLADVRTGRPGSSDESGGGDGAAAFAFGSGDGVIAEVLARASATAEFLDRWRAPGEIASSTWEERFGLREYLPLIQDAADRATAEANLARPPDHVVISSPHTRAAATAAKGFGACAQDELEPIVGYLGAAHAGLRLADILDHAAADETILLVNAADGADALVLRTTAALVSRRSCPSVREQVALAREVDYASFLTWRGVLEREPPRRPDPARPDAPPAARATDWKFAFVGTRCAACARVHVPPVRVCAGCGTVDRMDDVSLADRPGVISTFTVDRLAYSLSPPTIDAVVDFDGGGRFTCELTDCSVDDVAVGTRVEPTFRRMFTAGGVHNYFWKARPIVESANGK
jgi:hydroxymethylglutaryl-CoA synthase